MLSRAEFSIRQIVLIVFLLSAALALRLHKLGDENFWVDEIATVHDASTGPSEIFNYDPSVPTRLRHLTPLPHFLTYLFMLPGSLIEWSARLPSAIFGTLEVLVILILGWRLFSFQIGAIAAMLLAVSPLHLWYSQEARWYAQWSLTTSVSYLALVYAWKNNRIVAWIAYALANLFNVYTFIHSFFILALQALGLWTGRHSRSEKQRLALPVFISWSLVTCAAVPIFWRLSSGLGRSTGTPRAEGVGDLPYTFFAYAAGFTAGPTLSELHSLPPLSAVLLEQPLVLVWFAVYAPIAVLGILRALRSPTASSLLIPWAFGLPLLIFAISAATNLSYQVRYTLPALAAFSLILSCGISMVGPKLLKRGWIGMMVGLSVYSVSNFYWNSKYDKEHVRSAVQHIRTRNEATTPILVFGQIGGVATYYGRNLHIVSGETECAPSKATEGLVSQPQSSYRVWVMAGRDWDGMARACLQGLSTLYTVVDEKRFAGVDLWLLSRGMGTSDVSHGTRAEIGTASHTLRHVH